MMDFPSFQLKPVEAFFGADMVCILENEEQVRSVHPNQKLIWQMDGVERTVFQTSSISSSSVPTLAEAPAGSSIPNSRWSLRNSRTFFAMTDDVPLQLFA